ncbi:C4-dicarboxylate ABC transporter permease [Palaeococcus pacificus DY20341]|uniref:C4-dicarboxylate ABC transporter permease n=1 Tax=Palaeococcus pacificus DY20341 TaxID=1343739 RepID=A0A075LRB8_9EURY|nr:TRAP transporter fused permease subunit [Palaeococcus pacificus]AIF68874.1 C4-dicarboxylate ABC transporter permease [Palaeococcus pacificus DY20341]
MEEEKVSVVLEKTRTLTPTLELIIKIAAVLIGIYEILFIFNFNYTLYDLFSRLGLEIGILKTTFQSKQGQAFVLAMILIITYLLYPMRKTEKHIKKVPFYDYILTILSVISMFYIFAVYNRYAQFAEVYMHDVVFGILAIILVLEATRRVLGWVLPSVVTVFLIYGIYRVGFNWIRFTQQLYFDEGIFGIPLFVMTIYVFAFVFFGAFLLKIGVSDYITEFMISLFGARPGGPAKAAVVSSGLMGTVSGSSVANVLTTGTFTIPLMKKAGYPKEIAGAVEPVASTGGQLMPPIMGAAAFIMAEFLGVPYNKLIIAAVLPALVYYAGVYLFIDLETKRLGLKGMPRENFAPLRYFMRKLYILSPILVITVALVWGIAPHISAISSLGIAIWVSWIAKDKIEGHEMFYVGVAFLTTVLMFTGREIGKPVALILLLLAILLVALSFVSNLTKRNEKLYISLLFILFIAMTKYLGMRKEQILLMTGVLGIVFSLIVGYFSKTEEGKKMYSATYESMIDAGKTSSSVMLAAASAGLIQGVLTMTGLVTSLGYRLVDLTAGNLWLLLVLTMIFSLILGMGVPTTANYIITSLVAAPAIYNAVLGLQPYSSPVPGFATPIALLAAHFFVFYFGILADITPPVALASYAGSALAGGDFWKTALNAVKYALAGYIGPYIYFTHPEMFLITVENWTLSTALTVIYDLAATLLVMYILAIALTGWFKKNLRTEIRGVLVIVGILSATLHPIPVAVGAAIVVALKVFGDKV